VSAIAGAGLRVDYLHEREGINWKRWPFLVPRAGGEWVPPQGSPRLPLQYTLQARKD